MDERTLIKKTLVEAFRSPADTGTVVALSGPWGCGKTHLWREVAHELSLAGNRPAYVSVFGVTSLADLKAALLNEAVFSAPASQDGKLKSASKWVASKALQNLPAIFQFADDKIGGSLLAKSVDLTWFLKNDSVFCIDDLERLSGDLTIQDVLGFANFLAERRSARLLLIMNDEHLRERHKDYDVILKAYRERVITLSLRLPSELNSIADRIQLPGRPTPDSALRAGVLAQMNRSDSSNVRTYMRALRCTIEVQRVLGEHFDTAHLAFTTTLAISDAEGTLEDAAFYNFSPFQFVFSRPNEKLDDLSSRRIAFHNRHYPRTDTTYRFSQAIYDYIKKGFLSPDQLFGEVRGRIVLKDHPVALIFDDLDSRRWYYFSDVEHLAWMAKARDVVADVLDIGAMNLARLCQAIHFSSEVSGHPVPPDVDHLTEAGLLRAAERLDDSLSDAERVFPMRSLPPHLIRVYDEALGAARARVLRQHLDQAILGKDLDGFRAFLASGQAGALDAATSLLTLKALHQIRTEDRRFYFGAIQYLFKEAQSRGAIDATARVKGYILASLAFEVMDQSDAFRLQQIE